MSIENDKQQKIFVNEKEIPYFQYVNDEESDHHEKVMVASEFRQ